MESSPKPLQDYISIGITTKNRWDDLKITLHKLEALNYEQIPILIFDDGSDEICPYDFSKFGLNIRFQRFEKSAGLISRRNQLAAESQTKYYMSLDDDSFPTTDNLDQVLAFAEAQEDLLCLGFPVFNPTADLWQCKSLKEEPYEVRFYIGCGHLLHRERFLELGGYRDVLIHQGEEMDVSIRAYRKGFKCFHYPQFVVHHTVSMSGRNWFRMDYYGSRNNILWNDWYLPEEILLAKQLRNVASRLLLSVKVRRLGLIKGMWAAFSNLNEYKENRERVPLDIYQRWQELPEK